MWCDPGSENPIPVVRAEPGWDENRLSSRAMKQQDMTDHVEVTAEEKSSNEMLCRICADRFALLFSV